MHRANGMLGVNHSGTGYGHVRSGMCAAVEASPSAQNEAHLSNCLQDLNAALLLRERGNQLFSMVGGGGAQEGPSGQHALSSLLACKMCSGHRIGGTRVKVTAEYKVLNCVNYSCPIH